MEIVSGLTSAPMARLLQTWESLDKDSTKRFEDIKVRRREGKGWGGRKGRR
jgi:hypothetical protein